MLQKKIICFTIRSVVLLIKQIPSGSMVLTNPCGILMINLFLYQNDKLFLEHEVLVRNIESPLMQQIPRTLCGILMINLFLYQTIK